MAENSHIPEKNYEVSVFNNMNSDKTRNIRHNKTTSRKKSCSTRKKNLTEDNVDFIAYAIGCGEDYPTWRGAAAYVTVNTKDGEMGETRTKAFRNVTSNYLHLMAVMSAVNAVPRKKSVIVYTPSKYAANILSGEWKAKHHLHLLENYKAIARARRVSVRWMGYYTGRFFRDLQDVISTLPEMQGVVFTVHGKQEKRRRRQKQQIQQFT